MAADLLHDLSAIWRTVEEARVSYAGHHSSGTFRRIGDHLSGIIDTLSAAPAPAAAEPVGLDALVALFDEVYNREWGRAADQADDRNKAILGPADDHATREAIKAILLFAAPVSPEPEVFAEWRAEGWTFAYEPDTKFIGVNHPNGGRQSVARIEIRGQAEAFGHAIAAVMNGASHPVSPDSEDARRYRALRDSKDGRAFIACYFMEDANDIRQMTGAIADAAIDAAMQGGEQHG